MNMPAQKPGKSRQDYGTPPAFLEAIVRRFGVIRTDLAASAENAVAPDYFDEQRDSLQQDWALLRGVTFCNPPFADLEPWARKCAETRNRRGWTLLLTPASVGSTWFSEHVEGKAIVLALSPRLSFVGETASYPKDLILSCFGFGVDGFKTWRWKP